MNEMLRLIALTPLFLTGMVVGAVVTGPFFVRHGVKKEFQARIKEQQKARDTQDRIRRETAQLRDVPEHVHLIPIGTRHVAAHQSAARALDPTPVPPVREVPSRIQPVPIGKHRASASDDTGEFWRIVENVAEHGPLGLPCTHCEVGDHVHCPGCVCTCTLATVT